MLFGVVLSKGSAKLRGLPHPQEDTTVGQGRAGRLFDDRARSSERRAQGDESYVVEYRRRKEARERERRRWDERGGSRGRHGSRDHPEGWMFVFRNGFSGTNHKPKLSDERFGDRWDSGAGYGADRGGAGRRSAFEERPPPPAWDPYRV